MDIKQTLAVRVCQHMEEICLPEGLGGPRREERQTENVKGPGPQPLHPRSYP